MAELIETTLLESVDVTEDGVFRNVAILGQRSRNNRFYTEDAMRNAVSMYEGAQVYDNHAKPGEGRKTRERYGVLRNVRFVEAEKKLRGDLVYLKSQAQLTTMLKEDVERKLNFFGLSHVADGTYHMKNGVKTVTEITKVKSVDVVSGPGTVTSLMEQEDAPNAGAVVDAGPDPKVEALRAGLNAIIDKGGDLGAITSAITEFLSSMGGEKKEEEKPKDTAQEQLDLTTPAGIARLVEQTVTAAIAGAKPKKFLTPAPPAKTKVTELTEQNVGGTKTDAPPKDKAALKAWLRK